MSSALLLLPVRRASPLLILGSTALLLAGCASAPLTTGGALSSYDNMTSSDGVLTKSTMRVNKETVLAAKTVKLLPIAFSASASPTLSEKQRRLVANAANRSLCDGLSERFRIVRPDEPADLMVSATVTQAAATDEVAAGASKVVSIVPAAFGVPSAVPRLPVGLGSLSVEAEARDGTGKQQAAMIWGRGADSFTSTPRVSTAGDAYDLATIFGSDFSRLLVSGETPFGKMPSLPTADQISNSLGGKPKYQACEAFGKSPGVAGAIAGGVGMPPEWSDDGAAPSNPL